LVKPASRRSSAVSVASITNGAVWARHLTPEQLDRVRRDMGERLVRSGDLVCRVNEPADYWYGVCDGLVKMRMTTREGIEVSFLVVSAGGWFGEGTLLKAERRRYDIVALRDSRIALMPLSTFTWLVNNSVGFNQFLLHQLNERLGQILALVANGRAQNIDGRVAQAVAALFHPHLYPGTSLTIRVSQEELGHLAGVSRQRANEALHRVEKTGIIKVDYGKITVLDIERLRSFQS